MRIIPMQCGNNESYTLLFRENEESVLLDIYDVQTKECLQTLTTPFPLGGVESIRYIQSFDVMFFAQPKTYPCKLVRKKGDEGGYVFSFEDNKFLPEPVMDWNMNSSSNINVFAIPDGDLVQGDTPETQYYPKGVLREDTKIETVTISYSHMEAENVRRTMFLEFGTVRVYGFAPTENSAEHQIGATFSHEGFEVTIEADNPVSGNTELMIDGVKEVDGGDAVYSSVDQRSAVASFRFARVEKISAEGVYFYLGSIEYGVHLPNRDRSCNVTVTSNDSSDVSCRYGDAAFYETIQDAPVDVAITDSAYYRRVQGSGFEVAITVDGSNTNENLGVGQILALKHKSALSVSEIWGYDSTPAGIPEVYPPVRVLPTLPSKTDSEGNELRPASGGGYGYASLLYPVRGKVDLKTEGKWSGVIELQEVDKEQNLSTIATISSENALSNTSLSRDIVDFGSSVRVVCTRREIAYQTNKSINGDGNVISKVLQLDDGCQWTLTSLDVQTAYFRIKEKRTLSDGVKCYIAECIGGANKAFSTSSYALGAWGETTGYPEHIAIYQERLVYAGNNAKPTTLWLSKTNKWTDFELGTEDSSSITATLATERYDKIQWILPNKNGILIGTQYSEFSLGGSDGASATADNITATMTSNIGSLNISADMFGTATIMVKTGGTELYRIDYNTLSEESAGNQISLLASHLFEEDPVVDMFAIRAPSNMLFCLHNSGKLSSLTYEPEYGVTGWAQHHILDGIVCGCVYRSGGKDVLCLVAKRRDKYIIGELDLTEDVWTDDGTPYESHVIATPITFDSKGAYGKQLVIAGCDVYVGKGTKQFDVRLHGGDWVRVDNGVDVANNLRDFETQRVEIAATSSWVDEATVEIKSSAEHPLVVHAIGANIRS